MIESETKTETKVGFFRILKRLWPSFVLHNSFAFTISTIFINFLIVSNIIWPGESFHSAEMGILVGISTYTMAFSGLIFGALADRYSRKILMSITEIIFGFGYLLNGFVLPGLGLETFTYFLLFSLIRGFATGGFWPIINSFGNDSTEEGERSQFFGTLQALFQLFQIVGMVVSAILFQNSFWREYFWVIGIIYILFGLVILAKGKEPKRASTYKELSEVLLNDDVSYDYKLNKETIKTTIFTPTNIIAFVEGLFTTVMLMVPDFLFVPYIQSDPYNISPFASSIFMIMFGLPGGLLGSLAFAKLSDKLAKRNIKNRVYMIALSIIGLFGFYIALFFLPLPHLNDVQGNNLGLLLTLPVLWMLGFITLVARAVVGLWNINQPPILQAINLPEAQGTISSANQFLENMGSGTGPIVAGAILALFYNNYQLTVGITMGIGIIGGMLWLLATRWINKDVNRISEILKKRSIELGKNNKNENQ
ncbi:MAG: MFS transporter [Candidatus Lokiarchaeota archaeon]|nr:MFS transporter [Candidatus Lokiarchaeota archaeon]